MKEGFFRVAAAAPKETVADTMANTASIISLIDKAYSAGADAVVFPEMCVTAYTCADLFHSRTLLDGAMEAVKAIARHSAFTQGMLIIVGAPVEASGAIYNCAVAVADGRIIAIVPKTYIPCYNEFYEKRWFASAPQGDVQVCFGDGTDSIKISSDTIIRYKGVGIAIEICEDLWTPVPPSSRLSTAGAEIIFNLSASDDIIGKYHYLHDLVLQQSARCISGYVYASAGFGESSTDLVFDSKLIIAENGHELAANPRWQTDEQLIVADIDTEAIRRDRFHNNSFTDCGRRNPVDGLSVVEAARAQDNREISNLCRSVDPHPFVPSSDGHLRERCEEIIHIQMAGLGQRLNATRCKCLVVGISGGLDSTLALLVACRTFDMLGLDRKGIIGVTMPGFGTTGRTHANAVRLMETLGVSTREISIVPAVNQHFKDIGHDPEVHDVTYENSQARQRTLLLMDIANQAGGMVLGTGDLSELALGWATYNGDHMSMYGVSAGVPKTLVRHLTRYFADSTDDDTVRTTLLDIIDTPISPELIPAKDDGTIKQKTEDLVGPYELHDFFLYYTLRYGFTPRRILYLAQNAFGKSYSRETILKWERIFFRRFFNQQFKRSCLPDGPKVGSVCLSPRGDWRMPSDASSAIWLKELENL